MSTNNNCGRVVVLGFDGMDYDLTQQLIQSGQMPNLEKIIEKGCFNPFKSVFPPDSIPAWITAFTGKDPSEHGILDHVNYLIKGEDSAQIDTSVFHQKTFWDKISENGNEVCIINPFMAYPVWPVNGAMVSGPVFVQGDIQVSNPDYVAGKSFPGSMGGISDLPSKKNISSFYTSTVEKTKEQAAYGLEILKDKSPNLYFQTFLTTDRIQHHLWRYCDPKDPTYPGETSVRNSIPEFFALVDKIIGDFNATLSDQDTLIIMSDHGHGMRCTHCFNINEYLRQKGYLYHGKQSKPKLKTILLEKAKNYVLHFMRKNNLEDYMHVVARFVPNAKKLKKGEHLTGKSNTLVKASSFAGTNPFGGIRINKENTENYEQLRQQIIDEFSELTFEGKKIFNWIKPREEVYSGPQIEKYPDILFDMIPQLGTGMNMYTKLFTENPTHGKISGGHKRNGIFISNNPNIPTDNFDFSIEQFYTFMLDCFNVKAK